MYFHKLFLVTCFSAGISIIHLHSSTPDFSTWQGTFANHDWNSKNNWSPANVPGAPGNEDVVAVFDAPNPSTNNIVTLNASVTLNQIQFGGSYTISGTGLINLGHEPATLTEILGPVTINTPLIVNSTGTTLISSATINESLSIPNASSVVQFSNNCSINIPSGTTSLQGQVVLDGSSIFLTGGSLATLQKVIFQNQSTLSISGTGNYFANVLSTSFNNSFLDQSGGQSSFETVFFTSSSVNCISGTMDVSTATFDNTNLSISGGSVSSTAGVEKSSWNNTSLKITGGSAEFGQIGNGFNISGVSPIIQTGGSLIFNDLTMLGGSLQVSNSGGLQVNNNNNLSFSNSSVAISGGSVNINSVFGSVSFSNQSPVTISGGSTTFNSQLSISFSNQSPVTVSGGSVSFVTTSSPITFSSSMVTISGGNASFQTQEINGNAISFFSSPLTISGGNASFQVLHAEFVDLFFSGSPIVISGGKSIFEPTLSLSHSPITISTDPSNVSIGSLIISDSAFSVLHLNKATYAPSYPIDFQLSNSFTEKSYYTISDGNLDLQNSAITIDGSAVTKPGTYIIFTADLISNAHVSKPTSSSVTWVGPDPILQRATPNQIVFAASTPPPTQHQTLGSLVSVRTLGSMTITENVRESRMRTLNGNISVDSYASINRLEDRYFAQNSSFLSQATPVEQLGERAIERPTKNWSVYLAPTGSYGSVRTIDSQFGNSYYTAGFMTGFDFASSNSDHPERIFAYGIGSTFYYTHLHANMKEHQGQTSVNQVYGQIYGTLIAKELEELSLDFAAGAGYDWYENRRTTGYFGARIARSATTGCEAGGFIGLEYLFSKARFCRMGNFRFIPLGFLQYSWINMKDYKEHGAGEFNLKVHSDSLNSLCSFLGARMNYLFTAGCEVTIRPEVTLGWQREYRNGDQRVSFSHFLSPVPQTASMITVAPSRNTFIAGTDLYVRVYDWMSFLFNYQMSHNDLITDNSFYLQWKAEF